MKTSSTGMRTSEGWLTLIAMLYSALVAAGLIPHSQEISAAYAASAQAISAVAALLAAFGYTAMRTWLKAKHVDAGADEGPERRPFLIRAWKKALGGQLPQANSADPDSFHLAPTYNGGIDYSNMPHGCDAAEPAIHQEPPAGAE